MRLLLSSIFFMILIQVRITWVTAFTLPQYSYNTNNRDPLSVISFMNSPETSDSSKRLKKKIGKGAQMFPLTNQFPLQLSDSFPGGILPYPIEVESSKVVGSAYDSFDDSSLGWIISSNTKYGDGILLTLALSLVVVGFVRPMDLVSVAFISGYIVVLSMLASSPRSDSSVVAKNSLDGVERTKNYTPNLLALPPQGHIPSQYTNPLGFVFTYSDSYRLWLKVGAILGLVAPGIVLIFYSMIQGDPILAGAVSRPLFLICCQGIHENMLRRDVTPLPIRILVPVMYNTVRLGPLYDWMMLATLSPYGKLFAVCSFLYGSAHLFGFLIPIGVMRYLRAHFFHIEAREVSIQEGNNEGIGLLS